MKAVIAANRAFDRLPGRFQLLWACALLFAIPLGVIANWGLSFQNDEAQLAWLIWVIWVLLPRLWFCHTVGVPPWKR